VLADELIDRQHARGDVQVRAVIRKRLIDFVLQHLVTDPRLSRQLRGVKVGQFALITQQRLAHVGQPRIFKRIVELALGLGHALGQRFLRVEPQPVVPIRGIKRVELLFFGLRGVGGGGDARVG
jgi:hypothetical protein